MFLLRLIKVLERGHIERIGVGVVAGSELGLGFKGKGKGKSKGKGKGKGKGKDMRVRGYEGTRVRLRFKG